MIAYPLSSSLSMMRKTSSQRVCLTTMLCLSGVFAIRDLAHAVRVVPSVVNVETRPGELQCERTDSHRRVKVHKNDHTRDGPSEHRVRTNP